ncbi:hypothetical protein ACOMHN_037093 [Nucella lapillus]
MDFKVIALLLLLLLCHGGRGLNLLSLLRPRPHPMPPSSLLTTSLPLSGPQPAAQDWSLRSPDLETQADSGSPWFSSAAGNSRPRRINTVGGVLKLAASDRLAGEEVEDVMEKRNGNGPASQEQVANSGWINSGVQGDVAPGAVDSVGGEQAEGVTTQPEASSSGPDGLSGGEASNQGIPPGQGEGRGPPADSMPDSEGGVRQHLAGPVFRGGEVGHDGGGSAMPSASSSPTTSAALNENIVTSGPVVHLPPVLSQADTTPRVPATRPSSSPTTSAALNENIVTSGPVVHLPPVLSQADTTPRVPATRPSFPSRQQVLSTTQAGDVSNSISTADTSGSQPRSTVLNTTSSPVLNPGWGSNGHAGGSSGSVSTGSQIKAGEIPAGGGFGLPLMPYGGDVEEASSTPSSTTTSPTPQTSSSFRSNRGNSFTAPVRVTRSEPLGGPHGITLQSAGASPLPRRTTSFQQAHPSGSQQSRTSMMSSLTHSDTEEIRTHLPTAESSHAPPSEFSTDDTVMAQSSSTYPQGAVSSLDLVNPAQPQTVAAVEHPVLPVNTATPSSFLPPSSFPVSPSPSSETSVLPDYTWGIFSTSGISSRALGGTGIQSTLSGVETSTANTVDSPNQGSKKDSNSRSDSSMSSSPQSSTPLSSTTTPGTVVVHNEVQPPRNDSRRGNSSSNASNNKSGTSSTTTNTSPNTRQPPEETSRSSFHTNSPEPSTPSPTTLVLSPRVSSTTTTPPQLTETTTSSQGNAEVTSSRTRSGIVPRLTPDLMGPVYIEVKMKMTWTEFCSNEPTFCLELVDIVREDGQIESFTADQIRILENPRKTCAVRTSGQQTFSSEEEEIEVQLYLVNKSHHYDVNLTYVCAMLIKQGFDLREASMFKNRLIKVQLHEMSGYRPHGRGDPSGPGSGNVGSSVEKDDDDDDDEFIDEPGVTIVISIAAVGGFCCGALIIMQLVLRRRYREGIRAFSNRSSSGTSVDSIALNHVIKARPHSGHYNPGLDLAPERIRERIGEERIGEERIGEERRGEKRIGEERRGEERIGQERIGEERIGEERIGDDRIGEDRRGEDRRGEDRRGEDRRGEDRRGEEKIGERRRGEKRIGEERIGEERIGEEKIGEERIGEERIGEERIGDDRIGEDMRGEDRRGEYRIGEDRRGEDRRGEDRRGEERRGEERIGEERLG